MVRLSPRNARECPRSPTDAKRTGMGNICHAPTAPLPGGEWRYHTANKHQLGGTTSTASPTPSQNQGENSNEATTTDLPVYGNEATTTITLATTACQYCRGRFQLLRGLLEVFDEVGHVIVVIGRRRFRPTEVARDFLEVVKVLRAQLIDDTRQQLLQLCMSKVRACGQSGGTKNRSGIELLRLAIVNRT